MKYVILPVFYSFLLFASCNLERIVEIDDLPVEPHLVVNALLSAEQDTGYIHITESRAIYQEIKDSAMRNAEGYKMIPDAELSVQINGTSVEARYSPADSAYLLLHKLHAGDRISIESRHKGRVASSETILPMQPQIISVDTVTVIRFDGGSKREYRMFSVKIKDTPGEKNYYRLLINNQQYIGGSLHPYYYGTSYYSNDPVLAGDYTGNSGNSTIGIASSTYNYFSIFRDVLFDGREYTLSFYLSTNRYDYGYGGESGGGEEEIVHIQSVRLQSINEELYRYYASFQRSLQSSHDNISEPVVVYTNIQGGLGVLGGCNEVTAFRYEGP